MSLLVSGLATAAVVIHLALITSLTLFVLKKTVDSEIYEKLHVDKVYSVIGYYYKELALLFALTATSGSLYMSNVLGWEPCTMCWYQRILVYPLVVILAVGVLLEKEDVEDYALPLALIGLPISLYHAMLQRFTQYLGSGCSPTAISCATEYTFHYNYITVPGLAFTALLVITLLLWRFSPREY
ncbi:MAG: hypothetical protein ACI977_000795 [Candidatus Nanohaloarchaea archaeon]|jgi:hypothetical protein